MTNQASTQSNSAPPRWSGCGGVGHKINSCKKRWLFKFSGVVVAIHTNQNYDCSWAITRLCDSLARGLHFVIFHLTNIS